MRIADNVTQDDPFYEELSRFIDLIESDDVESRSRVLSSYADALKTYEFVSCITDTVDDFSWTYLRSIDMEDYPGRMIYPAYDTSLEST